MARKRSAGAPDLKSLVVYVHGIGAQPKKDDIKERWDLALFGRDLGERSRMAYWADILHPVQEKSSAAKRSVPRGDDRAVDLDDLLNRARSPAARAFAEGLLGEIGAQPNAAVVRVSRVGKKVLPLPAWARKPISRAFLKAFIGDTADYFFTAGMRARIRQRLIDALALPAGQPVTIVAHSQGSVVAYEVLSSMKPGSIALDALITIGSPLGIQEVQDFLDPHHRRIPKLVRRWHNFADPLDPVALDKGLHGDFGSDEPTVRIQDVLMMNAQSRLTWKFNPHSAVGYLSHPDVRRVVNDAMRMDLMNRFVLARDVAERLGAEPTERHAVLVEVLEPGYSALCESRKETAALESREIHGLTTRARGRESKPDGSLLLRHRIETGAEKLRKLVDDEDGARIDPLRRFIAAHLTADELQRVGAGHKELRVYAVWRSSTKRKFTDSRSLSAIKADAAHASFRADGHGITWAVLDTGVQANHPHFAGMNVAVYDCTKRGSPVLVKDFADSDGHGTHVAGIIAGSSKTGVAVGPDGQSDLRGVAPRARLISYRVLDERGEGEDAWIIKAIDHIAEQNENVADGLAIHGVNLSLGGAFDHTVYGCGFSPICAELRRLWRSGVLVVVACGNEGQLTVQTPDGEVDINTPMSVGDPANLEECIAVGSVNADRPHLYGISSFSSRGPTADGRAKPDVVAPGERILSCNARWKSKDGQYYFESGTSMAAPHVSGLLAAFLSARREFRGRPDEVKRILLDSCNDLGRDRYHQGRGMPNLMKMLLDA